MSTPVTNLKLNSDANFPGKLSVSRHELYLLTLAILLLLAKACGYMHINIGAINVINTVGPVLGSGALTLGVVIGVAAIFSWFARLLVA